MYEYCNILDYANSDSSNLVILFLIVELKDSKVDICKENYREMYFSCLVSMISERNGIGFSSYFANSLVLVIF
jgi:hypothetical protein